ncbi:MAG TPA: anaerobic glycerol-3-phosphate dehydrogenase subunit C [Symbiobacteriaceae bacterium]|nr:anaerobic glycerol-3-phosphate dehydrogenase subunit C [Symbiobacteriaceae bacterium]
MTDLYDACLKCSLCELHCPVFRAAPAFPGPKNGGPGLERLRAAGRPVDETGLDLCLGCRTCEVVCPAGLSPAALIHRPKIEKVRRSGLPPREWLLTHTNLMGEVAVRMPRLTNGTLSFTPVRIGMEKALRIARRRPMPRYASGTFRDWFARRPRPWHDRPAPNGKVVYFHGCSTNYMLPEIGRHTVAVLEHNGFEVLLPPQKCCGLPLMGNGELDEARGWARYNVAQLKPFAQQGIPIVFTSTSCSLTVKREYEHLLGIEGAGEVAPLCYDLFEFLGQLHDEGRLRTDFRARGEEVLPYHQPCHQRVQGIGTPAVRLLKLVPGLHAWNMDAGCCGASGTHGFKREKYDLSMLVGEPLRQAVLESGAHRVISDCEACRWQIEHLTGRQAVHPVTVLCEAYGLL